MVAKSGVKDYREEKQSSLSIILFPAPHFNVMLQEDVENKTSGEISSRRTINIKVLLQPVREERKLLECLVCRRVGLIENNVRVRHPGWLAVLMVKERLIGK